MTKLAILITSHNRKSITLRCLDAALKSDGINKEVFLVDDGSMDGTADAVKLHFPNVNVIPGNGSLYWNRGMIVAWNAALKKSFDFYLWLNDDTVLLDGSLEKMLEIYHSSNTKTIVCGTIIDESSKQVVYGGIVKRTLPVKFFSVALYHKSYTEISAEPLRELDTFHGNCVLIPHSAVNDVGVNSERLWHAEGDTDYGFRAKSAGYKILATTDPVAYGPFNNKFDEARSKLRLNNWNFIFNHPKGRRLDENIYYFRAHHGKLWALKLIWSYIKMVRI